MNSQKLLDRLELETGEVLIGIVDYVSKKHIHFFDFTNLNDPNLVLLAMIWRSDPKNKLRFSIYSTINYPTMKIPSIKLIRRSIVAESNREIKTTPPDLKDRRSIRAVS